MRARGESARARGKMQNAECKTRNIRAVNSTGGEDGREVDPQGREKREGERGELGDLRYAADMFDRLETRTDLCDLCVKFVRRVIFRFLSGLCAFRSYFHFFSSLFLSPHIRPFFALSSLFFSRHLCSSCSRLSRFKKIIASIIKFALETPAGGKGAALRFFVRYPPKQLGEVETRQNPSIAHDRRETSTSPR